MPYKVFKSGTQWCVHKSTNGSKGKKIGCHDSESGAKKQMRALYANEKEVSMPEEIEQVEQVEQEENETKERLEKGYVPWGVSSFAELEDARKAAEAAEQTYDLLSDYTGIVSNILNSGEVEDKASAVKTVTQELEKKLSSPAKEKEQEPVATESAFDKLADRILGGIKEFFTSDKETKEEDKRDDFMLWKETDGTTRWMAVYSNKFRDDDRPVREIISEISHIKFEHLVDEKQVPMPELWLWHVPEWKFGVADWVAWDTEGFALASGTIDEGKESVAEWISEQKDVAVSHGMPIDSIVRDPDDPSIIVGHTTKEISPLPYSAAANKRTDFLIISNETKQEEVMTISGEKKKKLQENWNPPTSLLERLEQSNAGKAKDALDEGVDFKETEEAEVEAEAETEATEEAETSETASEPEAETQSEDAEPEAQDADSDEVQPEYATRDEVVEALTPMAKQIASLEGTVGTLVDVLKEIAEDDEAKIAKAAADAPPASVAAMIARNMSVVGSEETQVKGSEKLAKRKPAEAETPGVTGVDFIDRILAEDRQQVQ